MPQLSRFVPATCRVFQLNNEIHQLIESAIYLFIYSIHFYFFVFVFCFCFYLFNGMQFTWGIPGVSAGVELHKVNILIHSDYVSTPEQFSDS